MKSKAKTYRNLEIVEISALRAQGCQAEDWSRIEVAEGFESDNIRNVRFGGVVKIGRCDSRVTDRDEVERDAGVYNAHLIDCTIGDNCLISNIGSYISGYDIDDRVIIENVGKIVCVGRSSFGNGTQVRTINEAGGREVPIYNGISAQIAYIVAMYRHRPIMVKKIEAMIASRCAEMRSNRGCVSSDAIVVDCGSIANVDIEKGCVLEGAASLVNGTLCEGSHIGAGVVAENFICASGSELVGGSSVKNCFVGEVCRIESGFTAVDSLFFSNSELANGEAVSVFAAPYTVSHHKSSLLIAGYFSFFNAGSGSNQSNHLFKTGAVHQGIHERGCKFASNAYIMLPAREGAFTAVIGRHTSHHDTQLFPYSYLVEEDGKSYLHPGANLRSFGTGRDIAKWPGRDRRKVGYDRINFEEYNPYIGEKLRSAIAVCREMVAKDGVEVHSYERVRIKSALLKRGLSLYELAMDALLGSILSTGSNTTSTPSKQWVDLAGMYAPKDGVDNILACIESGSIASLSGVENAFSQLHSDYGKNAYGWALSVLGGEDVHNAIEKGKQAEAELRKMRKDDGIKDAATLMMIGYGIDGQEDKEEDFGAVRSKK